MEIKRNDISVIDGAELKAIQNIYFLGIGGIGMSAIARYFHSRGVNVEGYDRTKSALTTSLEESGIKIHYEENIDLIPKNVQLVVFTPAVSQQNIELNYYLQNGYKVVKRSDVLKMITENSFNICVAGTHGKTTISTMIAHLLKNSGYGCNAFLGGISVNYGTNFWSSEKNVCVIEADEYDRSFLKLFPDVAVISSMDADHLDIYGTEKEVEKAFIDFSSNLKVGGLLVRKFGLKRESDLNASNHLSYSAQNKEADVYATNIKLENGGYQFDVVLKNQVVEKFVLKMGGLHNIENIVAAITVANYLGINDNEIRKGVETFRGVKRRFEYIVDSQEVIQIDDYAHHPEELKALINGAKTLFSQRKCTVIFQPHLFSRTKDFAAEFAAVLDLADEIILLPIYPARELLMEGVSSELILNAMTNPNKKIMTQTEIINWLESDFLEKINKNFGNVIITAGAGDIDLLVSPIKQILEKRK